MLFSRLLSCLGVLGFMAMALPLHAASTRVLILSGLAGDQKESDRLNDERQRLAGEFADRSIPAANIEQAGDLKRADILGRLAQEVPKLQADDALWLILLGHSAERADGPVFEVSGQRLTGPDLKAALAAIPSRQYVIIATEASGGFIADLAAPNRIVLTATEPSGEINETVFPDALADALKDPKNSSMLQLARAAALNVHHYYEGQGLVLTEHAMLSDPSQPQPLVEPFDKASGALLTDQSALGPQAPPAPAPPLAANEPALPPTPPPDVSAAGPPQLAGRKPATPETLAIIQKARAAAAIDDGSPAIIVDRDIDLLVNGDETQVVTTHQQVLIEKAGGVNWSDLEFKSLPPQEQLSVTQARTIFPDGSYLDAPIDSRDSFTSGDYLAQKEQILRLPAVTPGCVIEYTVRDELSPDQNVSGVYQELSVTQSVPILDCNLTLRLPKNHPLQYRLHNLSGEPTTDATAYSQDYHWSWHDLAAVNHLPHDPPLRDVEGKVLVSSYKTWADFAAWYQRISVGSQEAGDGVKARAAQVTAGLKTDRDKLRALFENVSKVHYAAIEFGVGGFRPHTPEWVLDNNYGDCKDKANLLLALARQVGIEGKFVLLNRTSSTDRNFPGFQFNHAIAFFPTIDGGLWLDSTDEITAFGQLPPGDVGRDALLMGPDPTFATIPIPPAQATQLKEHLVIDPSGKTPGKLVLDAQGVADFDLRDAFRTLTAQETGALLREQLNHFVPGAALKSYSMSNLDQLEVPVHLECAFEPLAELGFQTARLTPLPLDLLEAVSAPDRKLPLVLNDGQPFRVEQTLDLVGATATPLPDKIDFTAPGATASISYAVRDNVLTRKIVIDVTQPTVAVADYPAFRDMVHKVYAAIVNFPTPRT